MKLAPLVAAIFWISSPCVAQQTAAASPGPTHCPVPQVSGTPPTSAVGAPNGTADLNSVITSVTAALLCYEASRGSGPDALPHLQQAKFDFKTTTAKVGGFTVSFFIFKLGASKESDTTNQLSFTYSLPKPPGTGHALKIAKPPQPLADALVADMQGAAAAIKTRAKIDNLTFKELTITLQYGIQFDGNIGINVPIQLVTIGANYDSKRNDVQTVTLTFSDAQ
jgi:hypothetical protein